VLRGNRGEAAGIELGSSFVERITVNAGTALVLPGCREAITGCRWAHRRLNRSGPAPGHERLLGRPCLWACPRPARAAAGNGCGDPLGSDAGSPHRRVDGVLSAGVQQKRT
jgi:hypothetical protein